MKTAFNFCIFVLFGTIGVITRGQAAGVPPPTPYKIISRDGNSQIWERMTYDKSPWGTTIAHRHRVTEIASGLNYWTGAEWALSDPKFQISADGLSAYAEKLQYKVSILANLNATNSVQIATPDGIILDTTPTAIGLYDAASGKSLIIAGITNCSGVQTSSGQIRFDNAFDDVSADVLFTTRRGSFSQDIILKQNINPSDYGFPTNTTRIQIFTEFFDPPAPQQAATAIYMEKNQYIRSHMTDPDFVDHILKFGQLTFGRGRAFATSLTNSTGGAPVAKEFEKIDGASYLVESVEYTAVEKDLQALPPAHASRAVKKRRYATSPRLSFAPKAKLSARQTHLAIAEAIEPKGVDVDYVALSGTETNPFTLRGDTTYFVSGQVHCDDLIIQGGAVVKYPLSHVGSPDESFNIEVTSNVTCNTHDYCPAEFTAADDDSVGESMYGIWTNYSGTIKTNEDPYLEVVLGASEAIDGFTYANPALQLDSPNSLNNMHFAYAAQAIYGNDSGNDAFAFTDLQFVHCDMAVTFPVGRSRSVTVNNCLANNIPLFGNDPGDTWSFANCTFDYYWLVNNVDQGYYPWMVVGIGQTAYPGAFTNSIFSDATGSSANYNGSNNGFYDDNTVTGYGLSPFGANQIQDTNSPFKPAGDGSYYLADNTFRGQGVNDGLIELAGKTTWPPVVYSGTNISVATVFSPTIHRDTNSSPDLGYHYAPIDVAFGRVSVASNLTFTVGTVVSWLGGQGYGIALTNSATVDFNGLVTSHCYAVWCDTVQENSGGQGSVGGIIANGNTGNVAVVNAAFTRFAGLANDPDDVRDGTTNTVFQPRHCEFWSGDEGGEAVQLTATNDLFDGCDLIVQDASSNVTAVMLHNCTLHDNFLETSHTNGSTWPVWIQNCSFDGTTIQMDDPSGGNTNITYCDFNAFLTNADRLPMGGTHDVTNLLTFNWQTSWFGDFYLSTNSPLIQKGSTTANLIGLYHFTTQTNQTPEGTNIVDIGYHYVATDQYGNPLDSNADGIPDYLEDPDGNGSGNWDTTMFLNVIITQPRNGSTIP
jgi:hypothetical protein